MGWIIAFIVGMALIYFIRHVMGSDSTYGVFYYGFQEFAGSKEACQTWVENKIKEEKNKLMDEIKKSVLNEGSDFRLLNMTEELELIENFCKQNYKIIRLN